MFNARNIGRLPITSQTWGGQHCRGSLAVTRSKSFEINRLAETHSVNAETSSSWRWPVSSLWIMDIKRRYSLHGHTRQPGSLELSTGIRENSECPEKALPSTGIIAKGWLKGSDQTVCWLCFDLC